MCSSDLGDCTRDALAAGLMIRLGIPPVNPRATEAEQQIQARHAEMGHRYCQMSAVDICREGVRLGGGTPSYDRDEMIRAAVSGSDVQEIFTTSVNAGCCKPTNSMRTARADGLVKRTCPTS